MAISDISTNIKVLVRVRPLLSREKNIDGSGNDLECLVDMPHEDSKSVLLKIPKDSSFSNKRSIQRDSDIEDKKHYKFDECIWSFNPLHSNYSNNRQFYCKTGPDLIDHFFQGFNVCLLAYGQTGSGKTYTMMGDEEEPGLIPMIIRDVLQNKERLVNERINCQLKLSYMEIYNEQVKDLLGSNLEKSCKVREHPITGPYVEGIIEHEINTYSEFIKILEKGNSNRSTASTSMNDSSSRSHAIIKLSLKQTKFELSKDEVSEIEIGDAQEEMLSSITLVDLAGSERLSKTKVFGQQDRMKEGTLINKSLTVLGRCINILSKQSGGSKSIVPYRDSTLTYILKENLAGNSKTFMIFCISPIDFEESFQTLNYANQVKMIKTNAKANKSKINSTPIDWEEMKRSDQDVIQSLKDEINKLTEKLTLQSNEMENPKPSATEIKFNNLITYLDNQKTKLKFENQFLRQQLLRKEHESRELNSYVTYMESAYIKLSNDYKECKKSNVSDLINKTEIHIHSIQMDLDDLNPKNVL